MPKPTVSKKDKLRTHWFWVLFLIGVDYFSTLGYQPSIAYQAAGLLAPLATVVLVLVTILGALPVYAHVAGRSPHGQGATAMLERMVPGWLGKTIVLVLLGFAGTDFIFTRTLSTADAAVHLVSNPSLGWQRALDFVFDTGNIARTWSNHPLWSRVMALWNRQMVGTLLLLSLGFVFWALVHRGFTRRVIHLAVLVSGLYVLSTGFVIGAGLRYLLQNPTLLEKWWAHVQTANLSAVDGIFGGVVPWGAILSCILVFPTMALGLSGFELSMVVMPLIKGKATDDPDKPRGRIRNTRKMLLAAALIMSAGLLGSSLVTTLLIPPKALAPGGPAVHRALAYLAHGSPLAAGIPPEAVSPIFGETFGTAYDVVTITILCLAGASVTIGLRDLVPPYLHRLGMELPWAHATAFIVYIFILIKLLVTILFHADVESQRGAYATSILALLASASVASALDCRRAQPLARLKPLYWFYCLVSAIFLVTGLAMVLSRPAGLQLAFWSVLGILIVSMLSRVIRTTELRFGGFQYADDESRFLWESMKSLELPILVPHRPGRRNLEDTEKVIRKRHRLADDLTIVFIEAEIGDPSVFENLPLLKVVQDRGKFILRIKDCHSIAHALAAVGLELSRVGKPPEMHFGWSNERPLSANLNFVLFGEGNIPWMVRELVRRAEPNPERRPAIFIG
jgi:hypothetical protein